ncbi:MAG: hypothetical protein ACLT98_14675 [Eggerthellaceae bacterium]
MRRKRRPGRAHPPRRSGSIVRARRSCILGERRLRRRSQAKAFPLACGAEPAPDSLQAGSGKPLWQLIGGAAKPATAGAGISTGWRGDQTTAVSGCRRCCAERPSA